MVTSTFNKLLKLLIVALVCSIILGQFGRFPIEQFGAVYLSDVFAALVFAVWVWKLIFNRFVRRFVLYEILLIAFWCITLLSLIAATSWADGTSVLIGFTYIVRLVVYTSLVFVTRDMFEVEAYDFSRLLIFATVSFAILGLVQFVVFPDFSSFVSHGWDPHYYRVLSTFFDPNFAGMFMSLGFLYLLDRLYSQNDFSRFHKVVCVLSLLTLLVAIILTFSRSTYLAFSVGIFVFSVIKDIRIVLVMGLIGISAFMFIPRVQTRVIGAVTIDETASIRITDYQRTLKIIADYPLLGVGYNTFREAQAQQGYFRDGRGVDSFGGYAGAGADSSLLFTLATMGIIGFMFALSLGFALVLASRKSLHKAYLFAGLTAIFVHSQFVNSLYYTWIIAWLCLSMGPYLHHEE